MNVKYDKFVAKNMTKELFIELLDMLTIALFERKELFSKNQAKQASEYLQRVVEIIE